MSARVFDAIRSLPRFGDGPALARLDAAFGALFQSVAARPVIHVVGSNGKGGAVLFLEALLKASGLRVGATISPHYRRFAERFRLDGAPADDAAIEAAWAGVAPSLPAASGGFEAMCVLAAALFADARPDVCVVEAGIGGRLDPTRLFRGRSAILTSVDLEHAEILGDRLELIAADKVDVLRPGGALTVGWLPKPLAEFVTRYAALGDRKVIDATVPIGLDVSGFAGSGWAWLETPNGKLRTRSPAPYAAGNALRARAAARAALPDHAARIDAAFADALANFAPIGRFEVLARDPLVVCDVAHTPGAADRAVEAARAAFGDAEPVVAFGASADKDVEALARALAPLSRRVIAFAAAHKAAAPDRVAAAVKAARPDADVTTAPNAAAAAEAARGQACLAIGGIFSALSFRAAFRGEALDHDFY